MLSFIFPTPVMRPPCVVITPRRPVITTHLPLFSSPGPEELCKSGSTLEGSGSLGGSLSSLVEAFDEKVNRVLKDLDTDTQQMAPVQVRTQDEIMSESQ